jgi:hypothetical protein
MRKMMIIAALLTVTLTAWADDRRSNSTLVISAFDSRPVTVTIDGASYFGNQKVVINELSPGSHRVKVSRETTVRRNGNNAGFVQTLFSGWVKVPARSKVRAKVTRHRSMSTHVSPLLHYGHDHHQNGNQHDQYGSQSGVYECTSGQGTLHHGGYTYGQQDSGRNYPHGAPVDHHDHYGSQSCDQGCTAHDNGAYQQGNQIDAASHNHYGSQECMQGCPSYDNSGYNTIGQHDGYDTDTHDGYGSYGNTNDGYGSSGNWDQGAYGHQTYPAQGMDATRFDQFLKNVEDAGFESTRFEIARYTLTEESLSTNQTIELLKLFDFENSKIQIAKKAYDRVVDPENFMEVTSQFTFSSSTTELIEYMNV